MAPLFLDATRWGTLVFTALLLSFLLYASGVPGALLLGPMLAGGFARARGWATSVPGSLHTVAMAILGAFVGGSISLASATQILTHAPLLIGLVLLMVVGTTLLSLALVRWGTLPGSTAVWGVSPGAGLVMVVLAKTYGADASLVGLMQYLRVALAALLAGLMARFWFDAPATLAQATGWFATFNVTALVAALAVAAIGGFVACRLCMPAGVMLFPMLLGAILQVSGWSPIVVPPALQSLVFATVGLQIGLGFDRTTLEHAQTNMRLILLAIVSMLGLCAACGWALVVLLKVDPLTAYLATSPGGMDSMAVISASSQADLAFVMAMQSVRFLVVLAVAPALARAASTWAGYNRK